MDPCPDWITAQLSSGGCSWRAWWLPRCARGSSSSSSLSQVSLTPPDAPTAASPPLLSTSDRIHDNDVCSQASPIFRFFIKMCGLSGFALPRVPPHVPKHVLPLLCLVTPFSGAFPTHRFLTRLYRHSLTLLPGSDPTVSTPPIAVLSFFWWLPIYVGSWLV